MKYEIHITCEVDDTKAFKTYCESIGVKPIVIETENPDATHGYQVMTSSKHEGDDYMKTIGGIVFKLSRKFKVLRKKVEIQPEETKHLDHIYYESHLRLKLPNGFDFTAYKSFIKDCGFHLSKNIFKKDVTHHYQMMTYRSNAMDYASFLIVIRAMQKSLDELGIVYDKVEIEECIYDTNESVDNTWLNNIFTCVRPTPWDVAIHQALNNTTCGIEPIYMNTFTRRELQPNETGKIILHKNRYNND
jgi:hypothetical protein